MSERFFIQRTQSRITQVPRRDDSLPESVNIFARWTPTVKEIMEDVIEDKLDRRTFPFLDGRIPTLGKKGPAIR